MLKNSPPGSFVVRDSNSFPGAFGLAIKVAQLPPNVQAKSSKSSIGFVLDYPSYMCFILKQYITILSSEIDDTS